MALIASRWTDFVVLVLVCNLACLRLTSAFQCNTASTYKGCGRDLSLSYPINLDVPQQEIICRCASQTESSKRKYFAIKEENTRIACYALDYSQLPSLTRRHECFDLSQGSGIHVGTGAHAGVYEVSPKTITIPTTKMSTLRTIILRKTTQKPFGKPPPLPPFPQPEDWE